MSSLTGKIMTGTFVLLFLAMMGYLMVHDFHQHPHRPDWVVVGGDVERGRLLITERGCASCHVIPGVRAARARVGPQLHDFRNQLFIAGMLPNTPENLVRWIHDPEAINPGTAMPTVPMTEQEARDIAAYLYENP